MHVYIHCIFVIFYVQGSHMYLFRLHLNLGFQVSTTNYTEQMYRYIFKYHMFSKCLYNNLSTSLWFVENTSRHFQRHSFKYFRQRLCFQCLHSQLLHKFAVLFTCTLFYRCLEKSDNVNKPTGFLYVQTSNSEFFRIQSSVKNIKAFQNSNVQTQNLTCK